MIDSIMKQQDRDPFEKFNEELTGGAITMLIINALLFIAPCPVRLFAIAWLAMGLVTLYWRLNLETKAYGSDKWTEFLIAWKLWPEVICTVYFWPLAALEIAFCDTVNHSFRSQVESIHIQDLFRKCGPKDHARESALIIFRHDVKQAEQQSEALQQVPEQIVFSAKKASVCGAMAMTMATTTDVLASGAAAVSAPTPAKTTIETTSYGWLAVENTSPNQGNAQTIIEYARFRLTIEDSALHLGQFTEVDAEQMQYPDGDWLKQYYLYFNMNDTTTFRAGRMFTSAGWSVPAPHSVQTVNYPRGPYSFTGYMIQVEKTAGNWHMLADVSGDSSLSFSDSGQFRQVEGSMRIEHKFGPQWIVAFTGQASGSFARASLDFDAHPVSWLDARGMVYYDCEDGNGSHTTTAGAYAYAGVRPLRLLPQLELHGQADVQEMLGARETQPVILTAGVRLLSKEGKYSATADYQESLARSSPKGFSGLFLRFQRRF